MSKDHVEGQKKQAVGAAKEVIGKVLGSKRTEIEGRAEKVAGQRQGEAVSADVAVRNALEQ